VDPAALRQLMEEIIPFNVHVGVRVSEVDRGRVRLEVPFRPELIGDPMRQAVHGGVISMLADTAGGAAIWSTLDEPRARISTIDIRVDYLRPGRRETIVAEATVVRLGKRVAVVDTRLFHPSAPTESIATGKGVYNIAYPKGPVLPV
jgi:uncharacterized protein (TIGR00369 family)